MQSCRLLFGLCREQEREREKKKSIFSSKFKSDPLTCPDQSMLEALGSPGERSILSEKKRRTGTGDGEEAQPASFLQEESQAGRDGEEKLERRASSHSAEESGDAEKRSGGGEDGEKRANSEEGSKEEKTGQRSCRCSCQVFLAELCPIGSGQRRRRALPCVAGVF